MLENLVNLVGRMSLGERFDTDLEEPYTYKQNPNGITRCQSMMVDEDQHRETWAKIRETSSVPGDSSCSQWVEQSAREDVRVISVEQKI